MLWEFSNDPIEREFGKLRQGTGGANFLSAQQMLEKLDIMKAKLLLKLNAADAIRLNTEVGHSCSKCAYMMDEDTCDLFDTLPELEGKITVDNKMSLVHIAGWRVHRCS